MNQALANDPEALLERWEAIRAAKRVRQKDAAAELGVTESQLVAARVGRSATRLGEDFARLLADLEAAGPVMALTRNEHAVIEKEGQYRNVSIHDGHGQVLDEGIDLRLFLMRWRVGFLVRDDGPHGVRPSLQFFDGQGTAVHKVFAIAGTDLAAFEAIAARHTGADQSAIEAVSPPREREAQKPDHEIDTDALRAGWAAMEDVHELFHLLRGLGVARIQALRLVGESWATPVPLPSHRFVLERAAATELPIMAFVGNPGVIEIHSGPVKDVRAVGDWFNVLDPGFNLHLHEPGITDAWVVRKPTKDGIVTSLELYDTHGEQIVLFFGVRKPGRPELPDWRSLAADVVSGV